MSKKIIKNKKVIPIAVALFALVGSVAYIVFKLTSEKAYREKWDYYNDCGI